MIPLETNDSELLKTANAKATPFDPSRVRMMKASGHTIAEICAVFNISVGMVDLCVSTRLDKALQKSDREQAAKKLQKSLAANKAAGGSDPVNDFWVLLKVLHDQ